MLNEERKMCILKEVNEKKGVSVQDMAKLFGISESTIRRDITELSREGKLIKVYGGAVALDSAGRYAETVEEPVEITNKEEKIRIARFAAGLVMPGDYVYLDSGTTTELMIDFLTERNAIYVTNSISHAKKMVRLRLKTFLIGGELKENTNVIVGADAILQVQKYNFNKGFFGTNGINAKLGYTTPDVREALIKRVAIESTQSGNRYVLADHDKFGLSSAVTFSEFGGTLVITDKRPESPYNKLIDIKVV